jgi:plasmid rolling circle replication initiator protein Rep
MDNPVNGLSLAMLSPKDANWQEKKLLSETISQFYLHSRYESYGTRIDGCANYLGFNQWLNNESGEVKLKLQRVFMCKVRHCPCCSWSRSRVWKARLHEGIPKMMIEYPTTRFIFLTLTVPNCHITELRDTLNLMSKSFDRLMKRRDAKTNVLGYVRSMEVTRNPLTGFAHPHFHVLLAVKPNYFSRGYISQATWSSYWSECLGTTENRIVHVRTCKSNPKRNNDSLGIADSVMEVAKYCVKHTDMIADKDWLIEMTTQLHATKHVVLGGLIKKYVNSSEPKEDDILNATDDDTDGLDDLGLIFFYWNKYRKDYFSCSV